MCARGPGASISVVRACGRRRSGLVLALTLLAAALGWAGPTTGAIAGTYRVAACDAAPAGATYAWHARAQRGTIARASCPTRGDQRRGLEVRNRVGDGLVRRGGGASMTFTAPEGASLRSVEFDWDGRRMGGDWSVGLAGDGGSDWIAGCEADPGRRGPCRLGDPGGRAPLGRDLDGRRSIRFEARCRASGGCRTAPLRASADPTRARLAVHSAIVEVEDFSLPELAGSGGFFRDGWLRGDLQTVVDAYDNVGVRSVTVEVDGVQGRRDAQGCDFARRVPCPRESETAHRLDTDALADGRHEVMVEAVDSAGNARHLQRTIQVDNHAPRRIEDLRVLGGEGTRAYNSFDVRWTTPSGQVAPIRRAHYRLCRAGASSDCLSSARDGPHEGIDDLTVPGRGDWRLTVWLEDEAGNADPAHASNPVTLSFDERAPTRLAAGILTGSGETVPRLTVDYGRRVEARGSLRDSDGDGLEGIRVAVLSRVRGYERFERLATTYTDGQGGFGYRVPRGPSRTLRFEFAGSDRYRPAVADVALGVRAETTISVSRSHVRNGDRVRFQGRLLGRPYPSDGKLVELQARYRDRWRTFAVTRADREGRWAYRYRFGATEGRVTYPFRAQVPRERSYPYALGRSDVVRVTVDGR